MAASKRVRFAVLLRDNFTCRYCGAKAPDVTVQVDHVIPRVRGGTNALSNLVTACESCNQGKSDLALPADVVAYITGEDELDPAISRGRGDLAAELLGYLGDATRDELITEARAENPGADDDYVHADAAWTAWVCLVHRLIPAPPPPDADMSIWEDGPEVPV
jgi:hypothetical protein